MVSLVSLPLSDDDVAGVLVGARWALKARAVAIEFRAVFDNDNVFCGCPRASKVLKHDAVPTTIYNWMATKASITSASDADLFDALVTDFSALARVHTLRLHFLPLVTDVGIAALAHVHTLDLRYLSRVTDVGIAALVHVHTLTLWYLPRVTDVGIAALAHVHTLDLWRLPLVTDVGIAALAHVHALKLWSLPLVTDVGIAALARVHTLDVHHCGCGDVSRSATQ